MRQQVGKILEMVYELVFLPAILDQVEGGCTSIAVSVETSLPVGREFKLPSASKMLQVQLALTGTRRIDGSHCKCSNTTHLNRDLCDVKSALRDRFGEGGKDDLVAGKPLSLNVQLRDAKYDGVQLYPCNVSCTLTISDTTR